jgi:PAS domain S-box-containing protein
MWRFTGVMFVTLLGLFLGGTYLFNSLFQEWERAWEQELRWAGRLAFQSLPSDLSRPSQWQMPLEGSVPTLLHRVQLILRDGRIVEPWGTPQTPGGTLSLDAGVAGAWRGQATLSGYLEDGSGGLSRALSLPVLGPEGKVRAVLRVERRTGLLGPLSRHRYFLMGIYGGGLLAVLLLGIAGTRSLLRPFLELSQAAKDLGKEEIALHEDPQFIATAFRGLIDTLHQKEAELSRLYTAEQPRTEVLDSYQEVILGSISSGAISLHPDLTIRVFNKTAQQIFGYLHEGLVGRSCEEVFGEKGPITRLAREALQEGRIHSRIELAIQRKDGATRWIGVSSSILRDEKGIVRGVTFLLTDLTEIRKLQEQVMLRESLATVGQISAGIAHEVRNSLGAILGFANLLQKKIPVEDPLARHVQGIVDEILLLERTVRDFLVFARPAQLKLYPLDLSEVMEEALAHYREVAEGSGVKVVWERREELPLITGDRQAIRQAFGNLIRNAVEAMPGGGNLTISIIGHRSSVNGLPADHEWVEVRVTDTGVGVSEEARGKIFTPFFTSKAKGTGLGLALVQKTVVSHGGQIEVESSPGLGATFLIRFPAAKEE